MLINNIQKTPEDLLEDSGSHLSSCEQRIGCSPHPSHTSTQTQVAWTPVHLAFHFTMTSHDKWRQMTTKDNKCRQMSSQPGRKQRSQNSWDRCLRWSAKISILSGNCKGQWLEWQVIKTESINYRQYGQLAKRVDTEPIPMPKTSQ